MSSLRELKGQAEEILRHSHPQTYMVSSAEVAQLRAVVHDAFEAGREYERKDQARGFAGTSLRSSR
jgi:hypothetical protein